jgi:hypothetical protein
MWHAPTRTWGTSELRPSTHAEFFKKKKGVFSRQAINKLQADGWERPSKVWAHMVLHLPHPESGFGVTFNDVTNPVRLAVTKDDAFCTTTSRFVVWVGVFSQERQELLFPKDDLRDSSSWSSPPLMILRDIHSKLITQYDFREVCAPSQSQIKARASGGRKKKN